MPKIVIGVVIIVIIDVFNIKKMDMAGLLPSMDVHHHHCALSGPPDRHPAHRPRAHRGGVQSLPGGAEVAEITMLMMITMIMTITIMMVTMIMLQE